MLFLYTRTLHGASPTSFLKCGLKMNCVLNEKKEKNMYDSKHFRGFKGILLILLFTLTSLSYSQDYGIQAVNDDWNILPEKDRARVMNEWLEWRLENILPDLMREQGIDMWLIINRE